MSNNKTVIGEALSFPSVWAAIVKTKVDGASCAVVKNAVCQMLYGLAGIRDVDPDRKFLKQSFSKKDFMSILDVFIYWIDDLVRGADAIFSENPQLPAMVEYRRPLHLLQMILMDLREGSPNGFTLLSQKGHGDRTDRRAVREFKDQSARTYRFLRELEARQVEVVNAINQVPKTHAATYGGLPVAFLSAKSIQARFPRAGHLSKKEKKAAIAATSHAVGRRFKSNLGEYSSQERRIFILSVAMYCLSDYVDETKWGPTKRQPRPATKKGKGMTGS